MLIVQILITVFVLLLGLAGVSLNVLSLPGNWLMFVAAVLLSWFRGWHSPHWIILLAILALLAGAELIEFLATLLGANTFGASKSATWAALFGGIIGAIIGVPVPVVGSLLGAILGSFVGALVVELIKQKGVQKSLWAALGAALGRTAGMIAKISCGLAAWVLLLFFSWSG